jgi:Zn-dependent M28 family amino/carboxypeptidase
MCCHGLTRQEETVNRLFLVAMLLIATAGCASENTELSDERAAAIAQISGEAIRTHMDILAADDMEGREAGTAGYEMAANYVADQYRAAGLEPLGDDGSYFQNIEFLESRLNPESAGLSFHKGDTIIELSLRDDFISSAGFGDSDARITAPLIFAGHGIYAPEYGHDDFAGVDVTGKIMVVLSGAPPQFATDQRAYFSSGTIKRGVAVERGAVGMITVRTPVDQKRRAWERYLPGIGRPSMRWIEADGSPFQGYSELVGRATLSQPGAEEFFELTGHDLDAIFEKHAAGETGSFDMEAEATILTTSAQRTVSSPNVIGLLEGSDPTLKNEYIIYTAHLDHIGIRPGKDGDDIHNGFYDNAAGVATILEIASAMAAMEPRPRRSIIFASVTAEEKGLQGSSYLARNPPVPAEQIVANLNIDMPYLGLPFTDVVVLGVEHSSLEAVVNQAASQLGLTVTPDPKPEEVRFVRSDQFSFVKEGVPAMYYKNGSITGNPDTDGEAALDDFLKNHYHQASDDSDLPYDTATGQKFGQVGMLLGLIVADDNSRPQWNEGDFFGDKFAK